MKLKLVSTNTWYITITGLGARGSIDSGTYYTGPFDKGTTVHLADITIKNTGDTAGTIYIKFFYKNTSGQWIGLTPTRSGPLDPGATNYYLYYIDIPSDIQGGTVQCGVKVWGEGESEPSLSGTHNWNIIIRGEPDCTNPTGSPGSETCIDGFINICTNGIWVPTTETCGVTGCTNPTGAEGSEACIGGYKYVCSDGIWAQKSPLEECVVCEEITEKSRCLTPCYWYQKYFWEPEKCYTKEQNILMDYMPIIIGGAIAVVAIGIIASSIKKKPAYYYPPPYYGGR